MPKDRLNTLLGEFAIDLIRSGIIPATIGGEPLSVIALHQLKIDFLVAINNHNARTKAGIPALPVEDLATHAEVDTVPTNHLPKKTTNPAAAAGAAAPSVAPNVS